MWLTLYQIFIFLLGHLHFFLHFFFSLMENLFKGTEWSLTPMPDIITFMHLSIKECNGGLTIVVTERQHGEKIILTSELFARCFKLEIGSPFLTSCSLWVHNTTSPLHFQHLNAFLLLCWCRVVTIQSRLIAACRNKHSRPRIQCTAMIYIIFDRKSVLQ